MQRATETAVVDMAYLILVGAGGWTQRWEIAPGQEEAVRAELQQIGTNGTTHLPLLDPGTNNEVTFVVAWSAVAVGIITPSLTHGESPGQYA